MDLSTALRGMSDAKRNLESKQAITSLPILSEHMDRLATYASAVEDHLADLERDLEIAEAQEWNDAVRDGKSASAADTISKHATAKVKGDIKRLSRLVGSAWRLVGVKQSRFNHLVKENEGRV